MTTSDQFDDFLKRFDGEISRDVLKKWLDQFTEEEQPFVFKLLAKFRYYSSVRVLRLVQDLHARIQQAAGVGLNHQWYVPVGYVAKSGSAIALFYKKQNELGGSRFLWASDLKAEHFRDDSAIIFLDDFIGSGRQSAQFWKNVIQPLVPKKSTCKVILGTLVGYEAGIRYLKETTGFMPVVVDTLTESDRPFSDHSDVFPKPEEREKARSTVEKYGKLLYPRYPFGYASAQSLVGFFYSTPNNTLPIFWSTEEHWQPLLPRAEVFRDPSDLVGPKELTPSQSSDALAIMGPLLGRSELDAISDEMTHLLFKEFKLHGIVLLIGLILNDLGAKTNVLSDTIVLIERLKYAEHEKEPVQAALLIVRDETKLADRIFARAADTITINATDELQSFAQLVDGYTGALTIRSDGSVVGNFLFSSAPRGYDDFLPDRYHAAALASHETGGLLFLFGGAGRVSVFHRGSRILVHRGSTWHRTDVNKFELARLAHKHSLEPELLDRVLCIALRLSDIGAGALITLGDHDSVLGYSDPPTTDHIRWEPMTIGKTADEAIMPLMRQDGATIISADGVVVQGMTFLRPPTGVVAVEEVGKGSKHSSAAKISKISEAIVFAVSVDGRITLFSHGEHALKRMG
jgi:hypothetical protein